MKDIILSGTNFLNDWDVTMQLNFWAPGRRKPADIHFSIKHIVYILEVLNMHIGRQLILESKITVWTDIPIVAVVYGNMRVMLGLFIMNRIPVLGKVQRIDDYLNRSNNILLYNIISLSESSVLH